MVIQIEWNELLTCWSNMFITYAIGYGDEGRSYIVPPKASLRFEVELLGFWEVKYIIDT